MNVDHNVMKQHLHLQHAHTHPDSFTVCSAACACADTFWNNNIMLKHIHITLYCSTVSDSAFHLSVDLKCSQTKWSEGVLPASLHALSNSKFCTAVRSWVWT